MSKLKQKVIFENKIPLRGSINLQSSPYISNFIISLAIILNKEADLKGDFSRNIVQKFVKDLNCRGSSIINYGDNIKIEDTVYLNDSTYFSDLGVYEMYSLITLLSKKGFVELKNNNELIDFFKYIGFLVEEKNNVFTVYNKVNKDRSSLTFHKPNLDYFLVSILLFLLNNESFSISIVDINYEIGLILEYLKSINLVTDISHQEYTTVNFDTSQIVKDPFKNLSVPMDPTEFVFFSIASIATKGELEINGINPKFLANSLKIFSDIGAGYDSISEERFKIWGVGLDELESITIDASSTHLESTKVCLLPLLSLIEDEEYSRVYLDTKKYKSFLQDLNRLGASLKFTDEYVETTPINKYKSGRIYLDDNLYSNYAKIILALTSKETIEVYNMDKLMLYNADLLENINSLGYSIKLEQE